MGRKTTINNRTKQFASVGKFLQQQRKGAGVTQQEIADLLELTSAQYVSNIERGISPPSIEFLRASIKLYDLDAELTAFKIGQETSEFYRRELGE